MDSLNPHETIDLRTLTQKTKSKQLIPKQSSVYDYNRFNPDPDDAFQDTITYTTEIKDLLSESESNNQAYANHLIESISTLIYTSNLLENAGSTHFLTSSIAKNLLCGHKVSATESLTEKDAEYILIQRHLTPRQLSFSNIEMEAVSRARRQVIQHIYALKYLVHCFVVKGEEMSERLLKKTHRILTNGICAENKDKDVLESYGGVYRSNAVVWTFTTFTHPSAIQKRMSETIESFNTEVKEAQEVGYLDPYALASKYFHTILNIHPFDENSRLCRLFLNAVLLKYLGIVIPIGRDSTEAEKWKETVTRASIVELEDKEERGKKAAWAEIATLVAIQGRSTIQALMESLQAVKEDGEYKSIAGYKWGVFEEELEGESDWESVNAEESNGV